MAKATFVTSPSRARAKLKCWFRAPSNGTIIFFISSIKTETFPGRHVQCVPARWLESFNEMPPGALNLLVFREDRRLVNGRALKSTLEQEVAGLTRMSSPDQVLHALLCAG